MSVRTCSARSRRPRHRPAGFAFRPRACRRRKRCRSWRAGGFVLARVLRCPRGTRVAARRARHRRDDWRSTRSRLRPTGRESERVVEAIRLVESDAARPLELKEMAAVAGMSKYHFLRVFRRLTGVTPHQYLISARLRRAALALGSSRRPVSQLRSRAASATSPPSTKPFAPRSA